MKTNYLTRLIERQVSEGWSDREMSRQMGISNAAWTRIRSGDRGMGVSILRKAMQRFPEYDAEALLYLRSDASVSSVHAPVQERAA